VYAAGSFRNTLGEYYVAKFNGSSWSELGSGANSLKANGVINSIVVTNSGMIYAGGYCTNNIRWVNKCCKDGMAQAGARVFEVGGAPTIQFAQSLRTIPGMFMQEEIFEMPITIVI
jgi:hypothetical protein